VIRRSVEGGWLKMLGTKAGLEDLMDVKSWDDLKRWVAKNWDIVVDAAVKRLGEEVRSELETLRDVLTTTKWLERSWRLLFCLFRRKGWA
jgi:hypothetical protein